MKKLYLGDGVYASYDGYHVVLEAHDMRIFLDPHVLEALKRYISKLDGENS